MIQTSANLQRFGKKEPFMIVCNEYIESNESKMKNYLKQLATIPTERNTFSPSFISY